MTVKHTYDIAAAVAFVGLVCLSCGHTGRPSYSRLPDDVALDRLTGDQGEVLEQRGLPRFVLRGPLATTIWVYCTAGTKSRWVEFDGNGDVLDEGAGRFRRLCADNGHQKRPEYHFAAAGKLNCGQISSCTDHCSARCPGGLRKLSCLMACKSKCRGKGCRSARMVFDRLTDCIQDKCLGPCMGGPSTGCRRCAEKECATQVRRCQSHRCGTGEAQCALSHPGAAFGPRTERGQDSGQP